MGHDLVLAATPDEFENGKMHKVVTEKIYEICSECKSETMYDERSGEHYCPVCYTENENFLHKILKAVR
jgi:exosome complex RNA-binding protein Csl4